MLKAIHGTTLLTMFETKLTVNTLKKDNKWWQWLAMV
jgi:hypothetical protein